MKDNKGVERTKSHTFTITAFNDPGTLSGDTTIFIPETAVSGDPFKDNNVGASGFQGVDGNNAQITATFDNDFQSLSSFTKGGSNPNLFDISSNGSITLGGSISSLNPKDIISCTVTGVDNFGLSTNTLTISAEITKNSLPSASISAASGLTAPLSANTTLFTVSNIRDEEGGAGNTFTRVVGAISGLGLAGGSDTSGLTISGISGTPDRDWET